MKPLKATFEVDGERLPGRVLNLGGVGMFVRTSNPPRSGGGGDGGDRGRRRPPGRGRRRVRRSSAEEEGPCAGFGMAIDSPPRDYVELYEEMLRALDE